LSFYDENQPINKSINPEGIHTASHRKSLSNVYAGNVTKNINKTKINIKESLLLSTVSL
jgi:hypothetical protein